MPSGTFHLKELDSDKITLDGTLSVSGVSTFKGDVALSSNLSVAGVSALANTTAGNVGIDGTLSVSGITTIGDHIIPDTNDAYDIGSPEFKIRDMYVSDNSLWIGDTTKISNVGGSLKFRKRKTNAVPKSIIQQGARAGHGSAQITTAAALDHAGVTDLSQMRLQHWHKFMRTLDAAAKITDIFTNDDDDYEETSASDAWKEIDDTKIYTTTHVGIGTSDPDEALHIRGAIKVEDGFSLAKNEGNNPSVKIDTHNFGVDESVNDMTGMDSTKFTRLYRVYGTNSEGVGQNWYWGYANDDYTHLSLASDGGGSPDPDISFVFTTTSELYCKKVYAALSGNADTATRLQTARTINGVAFDGSADISLGLENSATIQATNAATANKIVVRDNNGDLYGRYLRGEYVNISHARENRNSDTIFYSSTDNYIRKNTPAGMISSLGLANSATIEATTADTANKIALRNASGDIFARLFRSDYQNQNTCTGAIAFRTSTSDNYIRFCSDMGAVRSRIGCANLAGAGGQNFSANNIYIGNSTSRGLRAVSGNFGTVQTTGGGAGDWEGYSINGRYVFMSANNNQCGIYNDLDNEWMAHFDRNGAAQIYHNGSSKLQTRSDGVNVSGDLLVSRVGYGNDIGKRIENGGGDYGTVTTQGSRRSWGGYAIQNQWVLMAHTNGNHCGIYNDQDNEWGMYCDRNSHTRLHYNGAEKLRTENWGVRALGRIHQDGYGYLDDAINGKAATGGSTSNNFSSKECYVQNWVRTKGNAGHYWEGSSNGSGWHIYPKNRADMYLRTGSGNGGICGTVSNTTARGYIHWTTSNEIGFLNSGRNWSLRMDNSNNCHVYGRMYASGYVYTQMVARYYNSSGRNGALDYNRPISVYAEHHMRCSELQVTSDRRIKTDIVDVDDGSALELLRKIQPKTYGYVDTEEKGTKRVYGFIAQEIKELIPEAVDVSEGDLPNIYKDATIDIDKNSITIEDFDFTSNLNQTESIIYVDANDKRQTLKIKSILNSTQLEIDDDLGKIVDTFKTSDLEEYDFVGKIFIWGQRVEDFHHLQKSAIFTVATAALQEVDRQLQAEKLKTARLEERLKEVDQQQQADEVRITDLETQLQAVLNRLEQ